MIDALKAMQEAGCKFVINAPSISGGSTHFATPEQAMRLLADKEAVYAELMGLSKDEYLSWLASEGSVYCMAKTVQGRQCRNHVLGGTGLEPKRWKRAREADGYCAVHGG